LRDEKILKCCIKAQYAFCFLLIKMFESYVLIVWYIYNGVKSRIFKMFEIWDLSVFWVRLSDCRILNILITGNFGNLNFSRISIKERRHCEEARRSNLQGFSSLFVKISKNPYFNRALCWKSEIASSCLLAMTTFFYWYSG
jgi:hypothetical protein